MHLYQKYIEKAERKHNRSIQELIHGFYIVQNKGPSVTAKELGIPRKAVIHFIYEFNLRAEKHRNSKKGSELEQVN